MKKKIIFLTFFILLSLTLTGFGCKRADEPKGEGATEEPVVEEEVNKELLQNILGKGKTLSNFSYDEISVTPQGTLQSKVWKRGQKIRRDSEFAGQKVSIYMDLASDTIYIYTPLTNTAMEMSALGADEEQKKEAIDDVLERIDPDTAILGAEKVDGHKTTIVQIIYQGAEQKIWFSEEYGLPLKMETKMPDETIVTIQIKNLSVNGVNEEDVVLPSGAQIMQLPSLPGSFNFGE